MTRGGGGCGVTVVLQKVGGGGVRGFFTRTFFKFFYMYITL